MKLCNALNFLEIYPFLKNQKFKFSTIYNLSECFSACQRAQQFYISQMKEILMTYAQLDSNGNYQYSSDGQSILLKPELKVECEQKIQELLNIEIDCDSKFLLSLTDFESIEIDLETYQKLAPFIRH